MPLSKILFSFKGRIRRGEFWRGTLISLVLVAVATLIEKASEQAGLEAQCDAYGACVSFLLVSLLLLAMYVVASVVAFAAYIKRYHDLGKSGWWSVLALVPLINLYVLGECGGKIGQSGPNQWGPDPLDRGGAASDVRMPSQAS